MISNTRATELFRQRIVYAENRFAELVLWQLPKPLAGTGADRNVVTRLPARSNYSPISSATSRGGIMRTVTLDVRPPGNAMSDFTQVWKSGKGRKSARISFATPELLWKVLTAKRWELLKALCGAGPVSIRETARRVERDVKGVHSDVTALLEAGLLVRSDNGGIEFPYEAVKVEFMLQAA